MKPINQHRKLFGIEEDIERRILKTNYRNLVKGWQPDKFQEGDADRDEAKVNSLPPTPK